MKTTFYDVLTAHAAMYPAMQPQDYIKLAFQSEFGCGHLLTDRESAYCRLAEEMEKVRPDMLEPLTVDIGGFSRLNLSAAKRFLSPDLVFRMFERSATGCGSRESYERKLSLIRRAAKLGVIPCDADAVAIAVTEIGNEIPTHSATFKRLYGASYRLVTNEIARLAPAVCLMADARRKTSRLHVAIDGRAASGKTTAAEILADLFDATLIHMDDYFLPAERRTPERLAQPGGNVDLERFTEEITASLLSDTVTHARFDCATQTLLPPVTEERKNILIVEGVYALHPELRDLYDVKLLLDTDPETQRLRICERNGEKLWNRYESEWIPLEEAYFAATDLRLVCDLTIST